MKVLPSRVGICFLNSSMMSPALVIFDMSKGRIFSSPDLAPIRGTCTKYMFVIMKSKREVPPGANSLATESVGDT